MKECVGTQRFLGNRDAGHGGREEMWGYGIVGIEGGRRRGRGTEWEGRRGIRRQKRSERGKETGGMKKGKKGERNQAKVTEEKRN